MSDQKPAREPIFQHGGLVRLAYWAAILIVGILLTSALYPFFYGLIIGRPGQ